MRSDGARLRDEFRTWLAGTDEVPPVVTVAHQYRWDSDEDDLARYGRVVSERRVIDEVTTPLPVRVAAADVDVTVLDEILDRHPLGPLESDPGELTEAVQHLVEDDALAPEALPRIVPTLRAFVRFAAREHREALGAAGVLALEDDLDDADVLVGLALQLRGIAHEASARTARTRAIVTVDCYSVGAFRLPLAPRPAVLVTGVREQAAQAPGLAVLRDVVAYVGKGRRVTDNGNLVLADVRSVAGVLGVAVLPDAMQSMLDVPAVAFAFRWAVASAFLVRAGGRVVPGDLASRLTVDPAGACVAALRGLTSVPTLLMPARRWRALPEDFAPRMLPALLAVGYEYGELPLSELEQLGWHRCTHLYDTAALSDRANELNRRVVAAEVRRLCHRLALLGLLEIDGAGVTLTQLGTWALQQLLPEHGYRIPMTGGFELPFAALLERFRELPLALVAAELAGWGEHHGADPAEELVRFAAEGTAAQRSLAYHALRCLPADAEPVVRRLLDDPVARPRALAWLWDHGHGERPDLTATASAGCLLAALAVPLVTGEEDDLRNVWLGLRDPAQRVGLVERLSGVSSPYTTDVLEALVACDPDRRVGKAARRALFKVRCR